MFHFVRYLAIIAIAGVAITSEPASHVTHSLLMHKDMVAATLIALLTLPNILRWSE